MSFQDFIRLTRRHVVAIIVCTVLGVMAAVGILLATPARYTAQATAYVRVSVPTGGQSDASSYYNASQLANQKVKAFVTVFTSESVAQGVIKEVGLDATPGQVVSNIKASNAANSLTIVVKATAGSETTARRMADSVVNQAAAQVKTLEGAKSPVEVVMMTSANLSPVVKSPSPAKYVVIGLLGGVVVGYVVALVRHFVDRRIRTVSDVTENFEQPILATVPASTAIADIAADDTSDFQAAEAMRKLRANIRFVTVGDKSNVLMVTSSIQGEGKSSVACNLAKVMALAGNDVILVEADMRRPSMLRNFGQDAGGVGLPELLIGAVGMDQAIRSTRVPGLHILPCGATPPNPSELLGSKRMEELLSYLSKDHVVIVDTPPVLPVADAMVLSKLAGAVIVVASVGAVTVDQIRDSVGALQQSGAHVAGLVVNRVATSKLASLKYGDGRYGSYTYGSHGGHSEKGGAQSDRKPTRGGEEHELSPYDDMVVENAAEPVDAGVGLARPYHEGKSRSLRRGLPE